MHWSSNPFSSESAAWEASLDCLGPVEVSIWPRRRPAVPAYARAWLSAEERVLTFASTPGGDLVVATPRGLWITDRRSEAGGPTGGVEIDSEQEIDAAQPIDFEQGPAGRLLPWEFIVTAKWSGDALTVISAEEVAPQIMRRLPPLTLALPEPADLPRVVRQRIDRSVVVSHRRALSAGKSLLLVGRRVSGRNGLLWYAIFDRDSDVDDPGACREAGVLLESAAASTSAPEPD